MQFPAAPESQSEEYLSDYAYIDGLRLSHYYGQLSKHGLVTQTKRTSKAIDKNSAKVSAKALVVTGDGTVERGSEEWIELQADPAFSRPQETLDALYEAEFIRRGMADSAVGNLVLVKGQLSIYDLRLMKELWQFMGEMMAREQTSHISNAKEKQRIAAAIKKELDLVAQVVAKVPHAVQGTFSSPEGAAWFTLKPECMLLNPEDLAFKHGCNVAGEWHVLGIVDALPNSLSHETRPHMRETELEGGLRQILEGMRTFLGRPAERYGMTPIMIFRTSKRASSSESAD